MIEWQEFTPEINDTYLVTWKDLRHNWGPFIELLEFYVERDDDGRPIGGEWDMTPMIQKGLTKEEVEIEAWAEVEPFRG